MACVRAVAWPVGRNKPASREPPSVYAWLVPWHGGRVDKTHCGVDSRLADHVAWLEFYLQTKKTTKNNKTWTSAAHLSLFQMMFNSPNKSEHLHQRANCTQHPQCCGLVCDSEQHYIKICCDAAVPSHLGRQRSLPWKRLLGSNILFCCFLLARQKSASMFVTRASTSLSNTSRLCQKIQNQTISVCFYWGSRVRKWSGNRARLCLRSASSNTDTGWGQRTDLGPCSVFQTAYSCAEHRPLTLRSLLAPNIAVCLKN